MKSDIDLDIVIKLNFEGVSVTTMEFDEDSANNHVKIMFIIIKVVIIMWIIVHQSTIKSIHQY